MRRLNYILAIAFAASFVFVSCDTENVVSPGDDIPEEVLAKLNQLGFSTHGIMHFEDGFLVENDIYLTEADIENMEPGQAIPAVEQYSTDHLVEGCPRVITIYMPTGKKGFSSAEQAGLDEAIRRYNAEKLSLTFRRVSSKKADIVFKRLHKKDEGRGIVGSAGFPKANGNPYRTIKMSGILESQYRLSANGIATIMAHEIGHCIGFRHTDFFDRSISCGGSPSNEGNAGGNAHHIPGTPWGADTSGNGSWMLACTDGSDRPFTKADRIALNYLY